MHRWSPLLVIALIGGALAFPMSASAATPVVLRVMEFNIEYGGEVVDFDSIVRAAQAADADVIAVEEGFGNIPRLAEALGYPYYDVRSQVISRLPLIDPPGGNGLSLFVQVAPGRVVALSNVHLPAGPYSPNLVRRGAPRSTILEIERRVRVPAVEPSVTALTWCGSGHPAILLGDFNTPSRLDWTPETVGLREQIHYPVNWPTSRFVEEAGFVDSYRVAHPDPVEDQGLTWPSGRPRPPGEWSPGPTLPPIGSTSSTPRARSRRSAATWSANRAAPVSRSRSILGGPTIARSCPSSRCRAACCPRSCRSAPASSSLEPTRRSRSTGRAGPNSTSSCSRRAIPRRRWPTWRSPARSTPPRTSRPRVGPRDVRRPPPGRNHRPRADALLGRGGGRRTACVGAAPDLRGR